MKKIIKVNGIKALKPRKNQRFSVEKLLKPILVPLSQGLEEEIERDFIRFKKVGAASLCPEDPALGEAVIENFFTPALARAFKRDLQWVKGPMGGAGRK